MEKRMNIGAIVGTLIACILGSLLQSWLHFSPEWGFAIGSAGCALGMLIATRGRA